MPFDAPNQRFRGGNAGHSSTPVAPIAGRGAQPSGDRFRIPTPPADKFPAAPQTNVGPTMVPIQPFQPSGNPSRVEASIPDLAGIPRQPK